jgi:hypothetical protein
LLYPILYWITNYPQYLRKNRAFNKPLQELPLPQRLTLMSTSNPN